jgi:uridine kinase
MNQVYIIGVAGGSASGKTTIVNNLKEFFKNDIELVSHDCYYKAHYEMPFEQREKLNYDHPNSFDTDLLIEDIIKLKCGQVVNRPVYSYEIHNRTEATVPLYPKKVIIVEGILILENEQLRNLMDTKIYVDTDADERLMRRILRDIKERGRTVESVIAQYSETVKPMHEQFIEPYKKYADIIIPRGGENLTALNILKEHLSLALDN